MIWHGCECGGVASLYIPQLSGCGSGNLRHGSIPGYSMWEGRGGGGMSLTLIRWLRLPLSIPLWYKLMLAYWSERVANAPYIGCNSTRLLTGLTRVSAPQVDNRKTLPSITDLINIAIAQFGFVQTEASNYMQKKSGYTIQTRPNFLMRSDKRSISSVS